MSLTIDELLSGIPTIDELLLGIPFVKTDEEPLVDFVDTKKPEKKPFWQSEGFGSLLSGITNFLNKPISQKKPSVDISTPDPITSNKEKDDNTIAIVAIVAGSVVLLGVVIAIASKNKTKKIRV